MFLRRVLFMFSVCACHTTIKGYLHTYILLHMPLIC